jgi:pimeloyl-ACP methyl ester carboxylesterase
VTDAAPIDADPDGGADAVELAHDRVGSGPALVLVHGITESRRSWDPLVDRLAADHDVVAVDLRGHGDSPRTAPYDLVTMATDVHRVVERLDLGPAVLVGHSLGGTVVGAQGALFGARAVVDVDQPLRLDGFREGLVAVEPALRGDEAGFQAVMAALFDGVRGRLDDDGWARLSALRRADQEVVLGVWSTVLETPAADLAALVESVAGALTVPFLSLHGTDPGPGYAGWLTGLVPSATVEMWDGDGHYPHLVEPDRFVARLAEFAAGLPPTD